MLHVAFHLTVPALVAWVFYRRRWRFAAIIMTATMVVDLDHLLASPVYDPERCSIGFHPLHTTPAILAYASLFALSLAYGRKADASGFRPGAYALQLIALGLLIHMGLDASDCWAATR